MAQEYVNTVTGKKLVSGLGRVLPHEHVFIDMMSITGNRAQRLDDFERMQYEVSRLSPNLPCAMVDVTPIGVGRRPADLRRISEKTGVNILVSTGFYRPRWFPEEVDKFSPEILAETFISEVEIGIDGTGIKAGIIGELGTEKTWVNPAEERVLVAAAHAQRKTNLTITLHSYGSTVGAQQLAILKRESVDLGRVIVGHCDTYPDADEEISYFRTLANEGAWLQFDTIRTKDNDPWLMKRRASWVKKLIDHKLGHQILLSHDVCLTDHLYTSGGEGYRTVWDSFTKYLNDEGISREEIEKLLSTNPQQALVGIPKPW
jgi:phosphotriesterase-related protein